MDIAHRTAAERIARVLAAERISANAEGSSPSAAREIDAAWPDYRDQALAILRTLREPSAAMAEAGDVAIWERMILTAIDEAKPTGVVM